ncbi:MAG: hypothetical protein HYV07_24495 [Deltaproteobacteria bacterium]|nr:hypothetical protein [Deltaproteobacteria bacterium]
MTRPIEKRPGGPPTPQGPPPSQAQIEVMKTVIEATAQITSAMVHVANEKNPAKISEAFKTIYKAIQETIKGG